MAKILVTGGAGSIGLEISRQLLETKLKKLIVLDQSELNIYRLNQKVRSKKTERDPNIMDLEKELSDKIGLKTEIQFNDNGSSGSLKLFYSDLNQLDEIMKKLKK